MSVSFKIERTPAQGKKVTGRTNRQISNHLNSDSSDNDETQKSSKKESIQFISHFDEARESRALEGGSKQEKIMTIPALPDRDFRAVHLARKQKRAKKELYRPEPINSMGGPSTQSTQKNHVIDDTEGLDKMNSKPIEGGLKPPTITPKTQTPEKIELQDEKKIDATDVPETTVTTTQDKPLTVEERAAKALLAQANLDSAQEIRMKKKTKGVSIRGTRRRSSGRMFRGGRTARHSRITSGYLWANSAWRC
ncbi:hypothetical protein VP01_4645g2 [Puccinia sorghi]|uniref:Uncharacterized protein n=1 Tax=Puccinia sorghi TaxID=27349 RepID=A0A0L6UP35_9BASI|nr:hypothetical protein VP01_4645g2 [Puccinia sorghi]